MNKFGSWLWKHIRQFLLFSVYASIFMLIISLIPYGKTDDMELIQVQQTEIETLQVEIEILHEQMKKIQEKLKNLYAA